MSAFQIRDSTRVGILREVLDTCQGRLVIEESSWETSDLGYTWQRALGFGSGLDPRELGSHPRDAQTVYRINDDDVRNIYLERSGDGGRTWQKIEGRAYGTSEVLREYRFLAYHPVDPNTLFVSNPLLSSRKDVGPLIPFGLYVSHDRGATFAILIGNNDPSTFAISKSRPATMYVGMFQKYVAKSDDAGATWQLSGPWKDRPGDCRADWRDSEATEVRRINGICIDPRDHLRVFVATDDGIWATNDGGATWCLRRPRGTTGNPVSSVLVVVKDHDAAVFAATDSGLYISRDEGSTWLTTEFPR